MHRLIVDKIDPTNKDVEKVTNTLSIYIGLHIFMKCDQTNLFACFQLISKKYFLMNHDVHTVVKTNTIYNI
jgi:hypothetical protein